MTIVESWYCVMSKYLGTGGKETKYNVDYVTTGSILKEFCGLIQ